MHEIQSLDPALLSMVRLLVADTTSLNTGCNIGVFKRVKDYFKRHFNIDVHTVECLMHTIEIIFKHFFLWIEGPSKAPKNYPANQCIIRLVK